MTVSRAMRRLKQVLEIQEEECRAAMESARAELTRLEQALTRSVERERGGRRLVAASAASGEITDRIAGIEESRVAKRIAKALALRIAEWELVVNARQSEFLGKRIERRQTETLIEKAEALENIEAGRRGQRNLDDWFLSRRSPSGEARGDEMLDNAHRPTGYTSQGTGKP
ncbi:MAG: hypothetical protein ABSA42_06080 [Terracidiphilus sp.]|jgi:hypothetical protein